MLLILSLKISQHSMKEGQICLRLFLDLEQKRTNAGLHLITQGLNQSQLSRENRVLYLLVANVPPYKTGCQEQLLYACLAHVNNETALFIMCLIVYKVNPTCHLQLLLNLQVEPILLVRVSPVLTSKVYCTC